MFEWRAYTEYRQHGVRSFDFNSREEPTIKQRKLYVNGKYFSPVDRPWLTEGQKVQKLKDKVYLALQHSLQKSGGSDEKLDKVKPNSRNFYFFNMYSFVTDPENVPFVSPLSPQMMSKLPIMKSICNLHIDKLEFFRLVHPETAFSFPPLYREVFGSEMSLPDSTHS